jgi:hypothetical protein
LLCLKWKKGGYFSTVTDTLGAGLDFQNLRNAAACFGCGISGPTTVSLKPGTYVEHVVLNNIPGSSCT